MPRRKFAPEIRAAALAVLADGTMTIAEVARAVDADPQTVGAWPEKSSLEARRVYCRERWAQALKENSDQRGGKAA
jgi:transposase-like protein